MQKEFNKFNKKNLSSIVKKFPSGSVLVIGDIILDEFVLGSPERISREAPVVILEQVANQYALGGASNAAHNISSIGTKCYLAGVVGEDLYSKALETECIKNNIHPLFVFDRERPTTVKTRLLSTAHKHPTSSIMFKQQLLRLDRLSREPVKGKTELELVNKIKEQIEKVGCVLISDYNLGVCTKSLVGNIIKLTWKKKIPIIVDSSDNFKRFKNSLLITPNQPDAEAVVGFSIRDYSTLVKAGKKLLDASGCENVLVTRGSEGMALFNKNNPASPFILPAFNVSEVFDVTGAGDTVSGVIASSLSIKSGIRDACILANLAASIVVKKYGTAVTDSQELLAAISELNLTIGVSS